MLLRLHLHHQNNHNITSKYRQLALLTMSFLFLSLLLVKPVQAGSNNTLFTCTITGMGDFTINASSDGGGLEGNSLSTFGSVSASLPWNGYAVRMNMYRYRCICPDVNQATCADCSHDTVAIYDSGSTATTTTLSSGCATLQSDINLGGVTIQYGNNTPISATCTGNASQFPELKQISAHVAYVCAPTPSPTQPPTEPPTQPPTQPPTEPPTQPPTQPPTEPPTPPACPPAPVVTNREVAIINDQTFLFNWNPVLAPLNKYQIWLINDQTNADNYYVYKLADNINPSATNHTVSIPIPYQNTIGYRFLLRAVNKTRDNEPVCYDQWSLGYTFPLITITPTETLTSSPTPTPTLTPIPFPAYWQAYSGLVYAKTSIRSQLPDRSPIFILNTYPFGSLGSAGIPFISTGPIQVGAGSDSHITDRDGQRQSFVQQSPAALCTTYSFDYFLNKLVTPSTVASPQGTSTRLTDFIWNNIGPDNTQLAYVNGDVMLDLGETQTISSGQKRILLVTGNVNLKSTGPDKLITVANGGFFGLIAQGNITFDTTIGENSPAIPQTPSNGNIEGLYVSYGTLKIASVVPDRQFIGAGSFIGCTNIEVPRSFDTAAANAANPTDFFIYRPDFMQSVPSALKEITLHWQEIP